MILFDDSEWEYTFIILMTVIFIGCGIYTFLKYYLSKKKEERMNEQINSSNQKQDVILEETVLIKKPDIEPNIQEEKEDVKIQENNNTNNKVAEPFIEFEPILKKKKKELEWFLVFLFNKCSRDILQI